MKKNHRFLSLLLAAVLVLGMMPVPAHAAQPGGKIDIQRIAGVNPHYADLFDIEQIRKQTLDWTPPAIYPQATEYLEMEAAAQVMRDGMANREAVITVNFITPEGDYQTVADELVALAMSHTGNPKEGDSLHWQWGYWKTLEMSRQMVDGLYRYSWTVCVEYYTTAQQEKELDAAIEALLEELDLEGQSDYDKIYTVYKYICDNVTYDYANLSNPNYYLMYTPYAALINGTSVCQGYALLFYRLMLELDIDCRFIAGDGGGPHGWNIVELDGLYYNVDSTWDAGRPEYWWNYFLNSFWDFLDHERNMEYDTIAFHNEYPMAAESYEPGVEAKMDPYIYAGYGNEERTIIWYINRNGTLEIEGKGDTHDFAGDQIPYYSYWIDELTGVWVKEGITGLGTNSFTDFYALKTIRFDGDAPAIASNAFSGVTATAYYPADNATWTAGKLKNYGGDLTWVAEGGAHTHSYTPAVTAPTCTEQGYTTYTCTCGDSYVSDYTAALGHAVGVWYTVTEATCTQPGLERADCARCNYQEERATAALGHNMGPWETVKAPTASEPGLERRSCSRCSYREDRTVDPIGNPCGDNAFWTFENGTLTITGTGAVQDFREYDWEQDQEYFFERPWDGFAQDIRRIVIGEGITRLGNDAFDNLSNLQSVELPSTLTEIGNFVFSNCTNLTQITLREGLQSLGQQCFWNCTSLKTIEIPSTVTFVDANVFENCKALTDVYFRSDPDLPSFATGNSIFKNCTALKEIRVEEGHLALRSIDGALYFMWDSGEMALNSYPTGRENTDLRIADNTIQIEQSALYGNPYLRNVIIPDTVTKIGNGAFMTCYDLQTVKFEGSAPEIQANAFWGANVTISYPANDPSWDNRDQWSADHLVGSWGSVTWQSYLPETAEGICGDNAVWSYANGTLTISGTGAMYDTGYNEDGSMAYPWSAFAEEITTVVIGDGITEIGQMNFRYLEKLRNITIADSVTAIGSWAFWGCDSLETVDLPDHLTSIGQEVFIYCSGLKSIEIPASVTFLDAGIFDHCVSLTDVYFRSDPDLPGFMTAHSLFRNCRSLEKIRVEEGHIAMKAIDGVLYLYDKATGEMILTNYPNGRRNAEFRVPDGTVCITQYAMMGCQSLETVIFPDSVTEIDTSALSGCYGLKTVRFEGSAPELGESVFLGCNLTAYYPVNDPSWSAIDSWSDRYLVGGPMVGGHQGSIEWVPYDPDNPFTDVPVDQFYYEPVLWAVENGITNGVGADSFDPSGQCTRAQVVTFLWRAAGKPEPTSTNNPFVDVPEDQFYYKAVLWAVEKGITNGMDATHFAPDNPCDRAQVVTFLWRAAGWNEPERNDNPFADVPDGQFYHKAVLWAVENGITNGVDPTHFDPSTVCDRAQTVTFLYRTYVD